MASKDLLVMRGRASVFYLDKAKTFAEDSIWIGKIKKDEKM